LTCNLAGDCFEFCPFYSLAGVSIFGGFPIVFFFAVVFVLTVLILKSVCFLLMGKGDFLEIAEVKLLKPFLCFVNELSFCWSYT
jgi:hypothetical protein